MGMYYNNIVLILTQHYNISYISDTKQPGLVSILE